MKNNQSITASAPGKLLLLGDHAIVYGQPCIVTAVNQRMFVTVSQTNDDLLTINAPDVEISGYQKDMHALTQGDLPKGVRFIEHATYNYFKAYPHEGGVSISTASEFSSTFGFGSSSATVVAVIVSLSQLFEQHLDNRAVFDLAYKTVLDVQGVGSGFDVASAIWGGTIFYSNKGEHIEPLSIGTIPLVVGYSGTKADTTTMVQSVAEKYKANTEKMDRIFLAIGQFVNDAKEKLLEGDWERVGKLMEFNQEYLRDIGVSTEKLEGMIHAAKQAGAYGAKLSGAGGGDCMIALVPESRAQSISEAMTAAGGLVLPVICGAQGVRVETTDNQDEQLIVINDQDEIIDYRSRSDCHSDPSLLHRTVGAVILNDSGEILLQKRSKTKDMDPGFWGISAAGHVSRGQTDEEAVKREVKEELGVVVDFVFVGNMMVRNEKESERAAIFKGLHNGPFEINPQEVDEIVFLNPKKIQAHIASKAMVFTKAAIQALTLTGALS